MQVVLRADQRMLKDIGLAGSVVRSGIPLSAADRERAARQAAARSHCRRTPAAPMFAARMD
jgi:hypothetical protein